MLKMLKRLTISLSLSLALFPLLKGAYFSLKTGDVSFCNVCIGKGKRELISSAVN